MRLYTRCQPSDSFCRRHFLPSKILRTRSSWLPPAPPPSFEPSVFERKSSVSSASMVLSRVWMPCRACGLKFAWRRGDLCPSATAGLTLPQEAQTLVSVFPRGLAFRRAVLGSAALFPGQALQGPWVLRRGLPNECRPAHERLPEQGLVRLRVSKSPHHCSSPRRLDGPVRRSLGAPEPIKAQNSRYSSALFGTSYYATRISRRIFGLTAARIHCSSSSEICSLFQSRGDCLYSVSMRRGR